MNTRSGEAALAERRSINWVSGGLHTRRAGLKCTVDYHICAIVYQYTTYHYTSILVQLCTSTQYQQAVRNKKGTVNIQDCE